MNSDDFLIILLLLQYTITGSFSIGPNVAPLSLLALNTGTVVPFLLVSHHVV